MGRSKGDQTDGKTSDDGQRSLTRLPFRRKDGIMATHVDTVLESSLDAGSIPARSTKIRV